LLCALNIFIREWAIVSVGLGLCGEDVVRLLLQNFTAIGVGGRVDGVCDPDVIACQHHIDAVVHSAQADGVFFVMKEGLDFFAESKSNSAAAAAAAAAAGTGAHLFEGSWSYVFDSVISYLNSQS
jgi:hypothetical protein